MKIKKLKLRDDQLQDVRKITHFNGRALIANQMRVGKTIIALQWLYENPKIRPVIITCPEIGKYHWEDKAKNHYGIRSVILNGQTPLKKKPLYDSDLYILNWDIVQYWKEFLMMLDAQGIILDECHHIKNPKTEVTKASVKITRPIPHVLAMSGTPLKSRPEELFTAINLVRPDIFPNRDVYLFKYCDPKLKPWGWTFKGATHNKKLHELLKTTCMIRRLRKHVLKERPKKRKIIRLKLKGKRLWEYKEAENNFIDWLSQRSLSRAKKAKKAKRLVQMGYLKRLAVELKTPQVLKWIDKKLEKYNKLAVFGIHKNMLAALKERYEGHCVIVDGSVRGKKRLAAVKTFQTKKWCRVFIGQTRAAGTVIELSKAEAMIGTEFDWTPGDVTQWEDRGYEQHSKKRLKIFYLVAADTIEEKLCKIIQDKQEVLSSTLDGKKSKNKLNVFDLLEQSLLERK